MLFVTYTSILKKVSEKKSCIKWYNFSKTLYNYLCIRVLEVYSRNCKRHYFQEQWFSRQGQEEDFFFFLNSTPF